jgi:hypothetical protein
MVALLLAKMASSHHGHKFMTIQADALLVVPLLVFVIVGVTVAVAKRGTRLKQIVFDRRQGMVVREARRLDPVWQGGIRLRDISAIELAPARSRAGTPQWELSLVSARAGGRKASLAAGSDRDGLRANGEELARFLNVPFKDATV